MNRNLLRLPRQTKLGSRKPDTSAFHNRRHLNTLDEEVLHRNTLVWSAIDIIKLRLELIIVLRQLQLEVRRVAQHIAILVLAVLDQRRIERLDDITRQIRLEPQLAILDALIQHELIQRSHRLHELLDFRTLLMTTKGQLHGIGRRTILVGAIQSERNGHRHCRLHDKALTAIVQVRGLGTALKRTQRRDGNTLDIEIGRVDDVGHGLESSLFLTVFYQKNVRQILFDLMVRHLFYLRFVYYHKGFIQ